jgi:hypothetical protein
MRLSPKAQAMSRSVLCRTLSELSLGMPRVILPREFQGTRLPRIAPGPSDSIHGSGGLLLKHSGRIGEVCQFIVIERHTIPTMPAGRGHRIWLLGTTITKEWDGMQHLRSVLTLLALSGSQIDRWGAQALVKRSCVFNSHAP